ncbi:hypothetical protein D3C81_1900700 [compost metagenome]
MGDSFRICVKLPVIAGAIAFMGAHHRSEGAEIAPAQQQLFTAFHIEQCGISADIAVMQAVAGHGQ